MKATVVYAQHHLCKRDLLWDEVHQGRVLMGRPDLYRKVETVDFYSPWVLPEQVCEQLFGRFNSIDQALQGVRSMSVGDVAVIDCDNGTTEVYVCGRAGFQQVDHDPQTGSWLAEVMR